MQEPLVVPPEPDPVAMTMPPGESRSGRKQGPGMEAPPLERKLIAILAADVEGYSRLMGEDEAATLTTLSAHRAVADALIARHGGRICNTAGDSILAEFGSIFAAVQCAVEIQRDL